MKEPKNALIRQYKKLFELDHVELEIEEEAVSAIAKKAIERKTGARGLRSIFEKAMTDIMFDIPSRKDVKKCVITKETITDEQEPRLVLSEPAEENNEADASWTAKYGGLCRLVVVKRQGGKTEVRHREEEKIDERRDEVRGKDA